MRSMSEVKMSNNKFSIPKFSIKKPHFTIVLALLLVVLGVISYVQMPARMAPKIPAKNIGVMFKYPGLRAEDMSRLIAQPLEKKLQIVGNVSYTTSVSQQGWGMVVLNFDGDIDVEEKKSEIQNLVDIIAARDLPKLKGEPIPLRTVRINKQNMPVVQFAITRDNVSRKNLREFVSNLVESRFQKISDVLAVTTSGGPVREVQIRVDREKMRAHNLSMKQLKKAIDQSTLTMGGGPLISYSNNKMISTFLNEAVTQKNLSTLSDVVVISKNGRNIYLNDLATVKDTVQEMYGDFFFNGKPAIRLAIQPMPKSDFYKVHRKATSLARTLEKQYPGLKFQESFSKTRIMSLNDANALNQFFIAVLLAGLVILFLLGEFSGTLITLAILPSCVAFGFFVADALGFQRDFGIMMGMVFIVGKLVDNSVVVLESVRRYIDKKVHPRIAAVLGTEEVSGPITIATLTFVIVLIPMAQLQGDMGAAFRSMTIPMIFTVLASLLLAVTLTPLMAAYFMKAPEGAITDEEEARKMTVREELGVFVPPSMGWFGRWITRFFLLPFFKAEKAFGKVVRWFLKYPVIIIALIGSALWLTMHIYKDLGQEQVPLTDTSIGLLYARFDPNVSPDRMFEISKELSNIFQNEKNVINISLMTGKSPMWGQFFNGYGKNTTNEVNGIVNFTIGREQREETMWDIERQVRKDAYQAIPELNAFMLQPVPPTPVAGARAPVEVIARGYDKDLVYRQGQRMLNIAQNKAPGLHSPYVDQIHGKKEWRIKVDEQKAAELGLSRANVISQAMMSLHGIKSKWFFQPNPKVYEHSRLLVRYKNEDRQDVNDLSNVSIKTSGGKTVTLSSIARLVKTTGYDRLHTFNSLYSASLLGYYKELGLKATTMSVLMPAKMKSDQTKYVQFNPGGLMITMLDAFNRLNTGIKISLIAVYLLLVIYFRSFLMGLVLMLAIPLEGIGAMLALWLRGMAWSPPVMWGLAILAGIVLSNSILVVDKIEELKKTTDWSIDRIISYASAIRLRPVLMTAITTGIAMTPVMFFPPPATEQFRNIATVIVGGLLSSTVMTLLVIPVAYYLMHLFINWIKQFYSSENLLGNTKQ